MPIHLPKDTQDALGKGAEKATSRVLRLERFADPAANEEREDGRKLFFDKAIQLEAVPQKVRAWHRWLEPILQSPHARVGYGQLAARLLVNMAGGVMENAGLCLDRFGMPYIPGSAVKGCARRTALAALHQWCANGGLPDARPSSSDNLLAPAVAPFSEPLDLLVAIARVFGWGDADWSDPDSNPTSDFAWACGLLWPNLRDAATHRLRESLRVPSGAPRPGAFAGSVAFLPAYPLEFPPKDLPTPSPKFPHPLPKTLGALELDIVTCHHREYYQGTRPVATDDEEPNPVVFPAVAPGHLFAFPILPLRSTQPADLDSALAWLQTGLGAFGLGAKTNAGYGCLHSDREIRKAVDQARKSLADHRAAQEAAERKRREAELREAQEKAEAARRAAEAKAEQEYLKTLTPDQQADYLLTKKSADQFRSHLEKFPSLKPEEKHAVVRALRRPAEDPGSRRTYWEDLKKRAEKGGKWGTIADAIRAASRELYGKEGKMP